MSQQEIDSEIDRATGTETTGHEWDGIKELNTPLPRWWLYTFYATIIWGLGYTIAYPAWPLVSTATAGLLGYSTRGEVVEAISAHKAQNAALAEALTTVDLEAFDPGSDLHRYAVARGRSVFAAQCSQCHGAGAAGAVGYPNLLDDDWLWGGSLPEIAWTVAHGIRNETSNDAHWSEMPAFGDILDKGEITAVVEYVVSLSDDAADKALARSGSEIYLDNCASCHGDQGLGDRFQGAPNLADAIWLYGGDRESLTETVTLARFGVMPAWGQRLSDADVRAVSTYVHALGGGE